MGGPRCPPIAPALILSHVFTGVGRVNKTRPSPPQGVLFGFPWRLSVCARSVLSNTYDSDSSSLHRRKSWDGFMVDLLVLSQQVKKTLRRLFSRFKDS